MGLSVLTEPAIGRRTASIVAWLGAAWLLLPAARASDLDARVQDGRGKPVADAVVLASPVDPRNRLQGPPVEAVDQIDKQFVPYVKAVFIGTRVRFPNKDNIRHQVYSFSPAKKFELPLYAGMEAPAVMFDKAGVVVLGCNIHDWMVGYIYVADTPFFGKTNPAGRVVLEGLPPGDYEVRVWHPSMDMTEESTRRRVSLSGASSSETWRVALKPAARIPRVSGDDAGAYP